MTFERQHQDLTVHLTRDRKNRIVKADLKQDGYSMAVDHDHLQLNPHQLYALVDDVAVADPDEWARRFTAKHDVELALRRLADYFKSRAEANRQAARRGRNVDFSIMADTFDLAVTAVMEEIEALFPETGANALDAIQNYHRRS